MLSMNTPVRWSFLRKLELLNEIRAGRLSPDEAVVQFGIGPEELSRWQELFLLGGQTALMARQVQNYRQKPASAPKENAVAHALDAWPSEPAASRQNAVSKASGNRVSGVPRRPAALASKPRPEQCQAIVNGNRK
jgi:Protein of unknown function (DUF1153)